MSLQKVSSIAAALIGLPKNSPELKIFSGKISQTAQPLFAELKRIGNDDAATPEEISTALASISQAISRLPKVPKNLEKLYKNTVFKFVFPIMETLYV
jgi:hypothetical protein